MSSPASNPQARLVSSDQEEEDAFWGRGAPQNPLLVVLQADPEGFAGSDRRIGPSFRLQSWLVTGRPLLCRLLLAGAESEAI